jgi:deoxyadenosine/deoxycytidine kinase
MKICIEGNIGVGKSETLKILKARGFEVRTEPVESWTLLEDFYENKSLAFPFQLQVLASFCKPSQSCQVIFEERCAKSGLRVFAEMLRDSGFITDLQMAILSAAFLEINYQPPGLIIYLNLSTEKCLERISKRSRKNEHLIDKTYLEKVESYYKQYLEEEDTLIVQIQCDNKTPDEIVEEILLKLNQLC